MDKIKDMLYHALIIRCNKRKKIFIEKQDYEYFMLLLENFFNDYKNIKCIAWSMTDTGIYILCFAKAISFDLLKNNLIDMYERYFLDVYDEPFLIKRIFLICEKGRALLNIIRSIHIMPIQEGIIDSLDLMSMYKYTGHNSVVGKYKLDWYNRNDILRFFSKSKPAALRYYKKFLQEGVDDINSHDNQYIEHCLKRHVESVVAHRRLTTENIDILGSDIFVEKILEKIEEAKHESI